MDQLPKHIFFRHFRYYASGNGRYDRVIMLQETVVTTATSQSA